MSLATTPVLSRNAVVQVGGSAIGFLTDFTMDVKAEMIKEYVCSSGGLHRQLSRQAATNPTHLRLQRFMFQQTMQRCFQMFLASSWLRLFGVHKVRPRGRERQKSR